MIRKLTTLVSAAAPLALTALAYGQEHGAEAAHEGHESVSAIATVPQGIYTGITAMVVFLIVFVVLSVKVWPTISKGLDDRAKKIRTSIEEAEQAQQQAREALEQYERNLASARAEAQKMLDDAKVQQQAIAAELRQKSDMELAMMRDKAKRDIDAAKSTAIAEIHAHATSLATAMAAKILKREISAGDQQRLIQESLQEMGAGRA